MHKLCQITMIPILIRHNIILWKFSICTTLISIFLYIELIINDILNIPNIHSFCFLSHMVNGLVLI